MKPSQVTNVIGPVSVIVRAAARNTLPTVMSAQGWPRVSSGTARASGDGFPLLMNVLDGPARRGKTR